MEIPNSARGFTLVELLIFMGLFSVILLVLSSLFASIVQQQLETQGMSAVETDATYLTARLQYDFDRADDIVLPEISGDTSDSLTLVIGGLDYTYSLTGTTLEMTTPSGTVSLTSPRTQVSDVSFHRVGNDSGVPTIEVLITLSSTAVNSTGSETRIIDTSYATR